MENDQTALVFFMTEWNGICHMIVPILEKISTQFDDRLKIGTVDVDLHAKLAEDFGVHEIPTILFFKNGSVVDQMTGSISLKALEMRIQKYL